MNKAYIGLGSNIEPRKQFLDDAIAILSAHKDIVVHNRSSVYETEPVGYLDQSRFLNMVIEAETSLKSVELLQVCQEAEIKLGRKRTFENGPRTVDLDILLFNNENIELEKLSIPHPRMHERAFVLVPLYELAPYLVIPPGGQCVKDLLANLAVKDVCDVVKWDSSCG